MKDIQSILCSLKESGNFRSIPTISEDKSGLLDLSSNDYLGLASDISLSSEFMRQNSAVRFSASASRLLAAEQEEYYRLESDLSQLYHRPVLLANSGYHANTGAISALGGKSTLIVADKLVHASIIDGICLSKSDFERFRHNDIIHLERILRTKADQYSRVIIITESIFSMDGDSAPISRIIEVKKKFENTLLYVDEAHAFGVCGQSGLGICANMPDVDIIIGTFGKAAASVGAFIACVNSELRDFFINKSRSFIFSTALPPINCAWTRFILRKITTMDNERRHLDMLGHKLADTFKELGHNEATPSHIQPFIVGDAKRAIELSRRLEANGIKALPIRTPTVPPGTERIRFSLSAALTADDIDRLSFAIKEII